uniref:ANK_REP_REGION domain-containing protein n=1 Tax=Macrostomum lignano TaxID=282301 RepID=A0A1I8IVK5_9PLAT
IQFFIGMVMGSHSLLTGCGAVPIWMEYGAMFYGMSMIVLFANFYYQEYVSRTNANKKKPAVNGASNGSVMDEEHLVQDDSLRVDAALLTKMRDSSFAAIDRGSTLTKILYTVDIGDGNYDLHFATFRNKHFESALNYLKAKLQLNADRRLHTICHPLPQCSDPIFDQIQRGETFQRLRDARVALIKEQASGEKFPCLFAIFGSSAGVVLVREDGSIEVKHRHLLAGKSFLGACQLLVGTGDYQRVLDMAAAGKRGNIDTQVRDILADSPNSPYGKMPATMPFFPFGKAVDFNKSLEDCRPEDVAQSLVSSFIINFMNVVTFLACFEGIRNVFFGGNFFQHEFARQEVVKFSKLFGASSVMSFNFLKTGHTAALGAALASPSDVVDFFAAMKVADLGRSSQHLVWVEALRKNETVIAPQPLCSGRGAMAEGMTWGKTDALGNPQAKVLLSDLKPCSPGIMKSRFLRYARRCTFKADFDEASSSLLGILKRQGHSVRLIRDAKKSALTQLGFYTDWQWEFDFQDCGIQSCYLCKEHSQWGQVCPGSKSTKMIYRTCRKIFKASKAFLAMVLVVEDSRLMVAASRSFHRPRPLSQSVNNHAPAAARPRQTLRPVPNSAAAAAAEPAAHFSESICIGPDRPTGSSESGGVSTTTESTLLHNSRLFQQEVRLQLQPQALVTRRLQLMTTPDGRTVTRQSVAYGPRWVETGRSQAERVDPDAAPLLFFTSRPGGTRRQFRCELSLPRLKTLSSADTQLAKGILEHIRKQRSHLCERFFMLNVNNNEATVPLSVFRMITGDSASQKQQRQQQPKQKRQKLCASAAPRLELKAVDQTRCYFFHRLTNHRLLAVRMPQRRGFLAPQNTFLDTIATRFDGTPGVTRKQLVKRGNSLAVIKVNASVLRTRYPRNSQVLTRKAVSPGFIVAGSGKNGSFGRWAAVGFAEQSGLGRVPLKALSQFLKTANESRGSGH